MRKQNPKMTTLLGNDLKRYREGAEKKLREATETDDILKWGSISCWFDWGNKTRCPKKAISTLSDIQEWIGAASSQERQAWLLDAVRFAHWLSENKSERTGKNTVVFPEGLEELDVVISFLEGHQSEAFTNETDGLRVLFSADHGLYMAGLERVDGDQRVLNSVRLVPPWLLTEAEKPSIEDALKVAHATWAEHFPEYRGRWLLGAVLEAQQKDLTAVHVTKQRDQKRPAAILKHPMGSIRDADWVDLDKGTLARFGQGHGETPESYQMALPGTQENLIVRPVQNLLVHDRRHEIAKMFGIKTPIRTKSGAVSPIVRISLEAILALEPGQTKGRVKITLGDLINFLNPDGKFHRTNQLPYIVQAVYMLNTLAAVEWRGGWWLPVVARSYPDMTSARDFPIILDVELPDNATQGPMALKEPLRMTGKRSLPQFNAYLSAVDVWDRYGTQAGRIIDPTRPVDYKQPGGERERDPKTDQYPILSNLDLMTACYPNLDFADMPGNKKRAYLTRAKAAWEELKKRGYVEIEKVGNVGWRILPTEDHTATYRALKKKV